MAEKNSSERRVKKTKCIFKKKSRPPVYEINLIPKPYSYQPLNGYFVINSDTLLIVDPKRKDLAELFQSLFFKAFGHNLFIHYNKPGYNNILFEEKPELDIEGYTIECYPDSMKISAGGAPGFFYAVQSIRQILRLDALLYEEYITFPCMILSDLPKYRYRGFMMDVSRHFFDKTEIKRYIEIMSNLKYNIFHWHLSDDQGFRFEIKKYPFINMTSSARNRDCVARAFTYSKRKPVQNPKPAYVDGVYKGYYTKEDVKEVVEFAKSRFVTVIPEIDVPGHTQALIAAYPWLSCANERVPVMTDYGVSENVLCAGRESTYDFVQNILDELFEVFDGPYIHIGGDEVLTKRWSQCPDCQKYMQDNGISDYAALQTHFINRIAAYCQSKGKIVIGWNDGIKADADQKIVSQFWLEDEAHNSELKRQTQNLNRRIIVSSVKGFYADYAYAALPLRQTYFYKLPKELDDEKTAKNIWGYEIPLWTEYVLSREKADMNLFPRALAVAETAWTRLHDLEEDQVKCKRKRKKLALARYNRFVGRVKIHQGFLDCFRVNYADLKLADPKDKRYIKAEKKKWDGFEQYSELKMNKNLNDQRKQLKAHAVAEQKIRAEREHLQRLAAIENSPIQSIRTEMPYDKDLV
ncbi:MAG: beta-N-acetylhexosaminidase [Clostridiales bacterium]|jgi:hexosaminidase|nr:beta-N-acetylhexosaminidase [Clostridiales bacterium]